jgi:hypothetical protein
MSSRLMQMSPTKVMDTHSDGHRDGRLRETDDASPRTSAN